MRTLTARRRTLILLLAALLTAFAGGAWAASASDSQAAPQAETDGRGDAMRAPVVPDSAAPEGSTAEKQLKDSDTPPSQTPDKNPTPRIGREAPSGEGPLPSVGWSGYFRALAVVFVMLGVIILVFWLFRRYGPSTGFGRLNRGDLQLEQQLMLGPKKHIAVVRFLNKRLVIGVTDAQISLLTEMEADNEQQNFSEKLDKARRDSGA